MEGLYNKYSVINNRTGKTLVGDTFVLRADRDVHARVALKAYADSISEENSTLADDIYEWLEILEFHLKSKGG